MPYLILSENKRTAKRQSSCCFSLCIDVVAPHGGVRYDIPVAQADSDCRPIVRDIPRLAVREIRQQSNLSRLQQRFQPIAGKQSVYQTERSEFIGLSRKSVAAQFGQVQPHKLSANAPSPCHEWPHSVQEMTPFADLRPMWLKQWRNAWIFCASVISGKRRLKRATSFCILALGFILDNGLRLK